MPALTPWMSLLGAAWAAGFGVFGLAGLRALRRAAPAPEAEESDPALAFELGRTPLAAEPLDMAEALRGAVRAVERRAVRQFTRVRLAALDDLHVRADARALRRMLIELLEAALPLCPGGQILVTARRHGGRVEVSVLADGPAESETSLRAGLRDTESLIALHGGTLEVEPRPDGAVLRMRLPELAAQPRKAAQSAAARAATPERGPVASPALDATTA